MGKLILVNGVKTPETSIAGRTPSFAPNCITLPTSADVRKVDVGVVRVVLAEAKDIL
jgi:hypothetical protein